MGQFLLYLGFLSGQCPLFFAFFCSLLPLWQKLAKWRHGSTIMCHSLVWTPIVTRTLLEHKKGYELQIIKDRLLFWRDGNPALRDHFATLPGGLGNPPYFITFVQTNRAGLHPA